MGLPSVRHSPLPLQSFLPLVAPQPPLPLQEFWPLQACFSFLLLEAFLPASGAGVCCVSFLVSPLGACWAIALPATNPVSAAPISSARIDLVMGVKLLSFLLGTLSEASWIALSWWDMAPEVPTIALNLIRVSHYSAGEAAD